MDCEERERGRRPERGWLVDKDLLYYISTFLFLSIDFCLHIRLVLIRLFIIRRNKSILYEVFYIFVRNEARVSS